MDETKNTKGSFTKGQSAAVQEEQEEQQSLKHSTCLVKCRRALTPSSERKLCQVGGVQSPRLLA